MWRACAKINFWLNWNASGWNVATTRALELEDTQCPFVNVLNLNQSMEKICGTLEPCMKSMFRHQWNEMNNFWRESHWFSHLQSPFTGKKYQNETNSGTSVWLLSFVSLLGLCLRWHNRWPMRSCAAANFHSDTFPLTLRFVFGFPNKLKVVSAQVLGGVGCWWRLATADIGLSSNEHNTTNGNAIIIFSRAFFFSFNVVGCRRPCDRGWLIFAVVPCFRFFGFIKWQSRMQTRTRAPFFPGRKTVDVDVSVSFTEKKELANATHVRYAYVGVFVRSVRPKKNPWN